MTNILFAHQTAELYGSDRTLLTLIKSLDPEEFSSIAVIPQTGPLVSELESEGTRVYKLPVGRLSRSSLTVPGLVRLCWELIEAMYKMEATFSKIKIDIVHSNTLAVLAPALWARRHGLVHVWHVHEIIRRPQIVRLAFAWLLDRLSRHIVFNSNASRESMLEVRASLANKSSVIWNGIPDTATSDSSLRIKLDVGPSEVLVAFAGRISSWKGQSLLVEAAEILERSGLTGIRYLIVGSPPPGQDYWRDRLVAQLESSNVKSRFILREFYPRIERVWAACDIAVVPSLEPEPFGLVAVEAMLAGKPVIAASHGGLKEIVVDGETGLLFTPRSAQALAERLRELVSDPEKRKQMGNQGRSRASREFSVEKHVLAFQSIYSQAARSRQKPAPSNHR